MSKEKKTRNEAQVKAEKKYNASREPRYKAWTFIFYKETAPVDWEEFCSDLHLKIWISPVHDSDKWTKKDEKENAKHKAGELKKPHYHGVVEYPVQASLTEVKKDFEFLSPALPSGKSFERVKDLVSMVRYLTHKDDPNKAQYDSSNIRCFGGANLDTYEELGKGEIRKELKAMRKYIRDNSITEFDLFWDYCDDCMQNWSQILDDRCYGIEKYIKARRSRLKDERKEALQASRHYADIRVTRHDDGWLCEACGEVYESRYAAVMCSCVSSEED